MSATTHVTIPDFQSNIPYFMGKVFSGQNKIVIGEPVTKGKSAVLISMDEYRKLRDPSLLYSDKQWNDLFMIFDKTKEKNKSKTAVKLQEDIEEAISAVRNE